MQWLFFKFRNPTLNKKHSWCCGTPEPRIFIARCRNWRKHIIIIYRCSRYIKYLHLLPWSTIASGGRNQLAKFGYSALRTFRDIGLRIWKRFCVIQTNGVSWNHKIWRKFRRYWILSPVQIWYIYVDLFQRYWIEKSEKYFTKWRLAGERKWPVTSNLVWEHLSSSFTSGPYLVILAQTVFKRSRCRDDDDDGVRGLCHKRLRQLRWVRALKTFKYLISWLPKIRSV